MNSLIEIFNNREKALFVWLIAFFIFALFQKSIRSAFLNLLKAFFQAKILTVIAGMAIYVSLIAYLLYQITFWNISLIKDTIFWFFGTAFVLAVNASKIEKEEHYLKKLFWDNLKLIIAIEFIVNFYAFSFWVEIILIPILFIVAAMNVVAGTTEEYKSAKKFTDGLLAIFGLFIIVYTVVQIFNDFQNLATFDNLLAFLLPIILTISFIPFLYTFALFMAYEMFFVRLSIFMPENKELLRFTKRKIFALCKVDLRKLNRLSKPFFKELTMSSDKDDVLKIIEELKK